MALLDYLLAAHMGGPRVGMLADLGLPEPAAAPATMAMTAMPGVPGVPAAPFSVAPGGFAWDEPGLADSARTAAAERVTRGVRGRHVSRETAPPLEPQEPIPHLDMLAGLLSGQTGLNLAPGFDPLGPAPASPALAAAPGLDAPPSTNDPGSAEPVVFADGVPLPRPRPPEAGANPEPDPTEASAQSRLPGGAQPTAAQGAPAAAPGAPLSLAPGQGEGGLFSKIFDPAKAPLWLALGAGFSGAPSLGTGLRRASTAALPVSALMRKEQLDTTSKAETYRALVARGASPQEALAATRSPEMLKALVAKYFETKPAVNVNGRMVRERPDGSVDVLADFSEEKSPSGFKRNADGSLSYIPGGPADPKYKRVAGDRQNAPPGYRYVNPDDPESKLVAIEGGPAEKVDANVAARLGLAQSFRDQLPDIRARVKRGEATGPWDAFVAKMGYGSPGELRRQIKSGSEALLRNLTGAGMNMTEASNYASRYELQAHDTPTTMLSKLDQLARELAYTDEAVKKGRGGTIRIQNGQIVATEEGGGAPAAKGTTKSGVSWSVN